MIFLSETFFPCFFHVHLNILDEVVSSLYAIFGTPCISGGENCPKVTIDQQEKTDDERQGSAKSRDEVAKPMRPSPPKNEEEADNLEARLEVET
jgi:hypothetical protein